MNEAVCHCGQLMSEHTILSGCTYAVEMERPMNERMSSQRVEFFIRQEKREHLFPWEQELLAEVIALHQDLVTMRERVRLSAGDAHQAQERSWHSSQRAETERDRRIIAEKKVERMLEANTVVLDAYQVATYGYGEPGVNVLSEVQQARAELAEARLTKANERLMEQNICPKCFKMAGISSGVIVHHDGCAYCEEKYDV